MQVARGIVVVMGAFQVSAGRWGEGQGVGSTETTEREQAGRERDRCAAFKEHCCSVLFARFWRFSRLVHTSPSAIHPTHHTQAPPNHQNRLAMRRSTALSPKGVTQKRA